MSSVLYASVILLCLAGVAFSYEYLWLNIFSKLPDISSRHSSGIIAAKTAMALSLVFSLLHCLLADPTEADKIIKHTSGLFTIITISWMIVMIGCGISVLIMLILEKFSKPLLQSVRKLFRVALLGFLLGLIPAWLLK